MVYSRRWLLLQCIVDVIEISVAEPSSLLAAPAPGRPILAENVVRVKYVESLDVVCWRLEQ